MKIGKKLISLLLCLLLFVSAVPCTAFAEEADKEDEYEILVDELRDMSKMLSHSDGFEIIELNPEEYSDDNFALSMGSAAEGAEIVYEVPFVIGSYTAYVQGAADTSAKLSFYYSKDGKEYVKDKYTEHRTHGSGRVYTDPEVLKDYRFLKIVFETRPYADKSFITKIEIREEPFVAVGGTRIKKTEKSTYDYKSLPSLKEAYKDYFPIGVAAEWFDIQAYPDMLTTQFNTICSENQSQFGGLQKTEGQFELQWAERIFDFGVQNNMSVGLHALFYYTGTPDWIVVQPGGGPVTEEVLFKRFENHIKTVVGHFKGKVKYYDVVNELVDRGVYRDYMKEWRALNGDQEKFEELVANCFKWAHEADPDAGLIFLDNKLETKEKRDIIWKGIIPRILEKGVPRDKLILGQQGHFGMNVPIYVEDDPENSIEAMILDAKETGFPLAITELDLGLNSAAYASELKGEKTTLTREERAELQAKKYATIFDLFREYADVIEFVRFWNVTDNTNWRTQTTDTNALLFDYNYEPYPAFYRLFDFEKKEPRWTMDDVVEISYANGWSPREIQAAYGTPVVDGKLDSIWESTEVAEIDRQTLGKEGEGATGNVRVLWDEKCIYVYTEVKDDILNTANEYTYFRDNIEVFIGEKNTKVNFYDAGDCQLRYTVDEEKSGNQYGGYKEGCFDAAMVKTKDGYNMEFVYNMEYGDNAENKIIGFDCSITDHIDGSSVRRSQRKFCDSISETSQVTTNWGTAKLVYDYVSENISEDMQEENGSEKISAEIDGRKTTFNAIKAENGEYLVPLKSVMEFLGGSVRYNPETAEITLTCNGEIVNLSDSSVSAFGGKLYVSLNSLCSSFRLDLKL